MDVLSSGNVIVLCASTKSGNAKFIVASPTQLKWLRVSWRICPLNVDTSWPEGSSRHFEMRLAGAGSLLPSNRRDQKLATSSPPQRFAYNNVGCLALRRQGQLGLAASFVCALRASLRNPKNGLRRGNLSKLTQDRLAVSRRASGKPALSTPWATMRRIASLTRLTGPRRIGIAKVTTNAEAIEDVYQRQIGPRR